MRALLRIAREHDVDVLSVQELRPKTDARGSTGRARASSSRAGVLDPRTGAVGLGRALAHCRCAVVDTAPTARGTRSRRSIARRSPGAPPVRIKAVHPRAAGQPRRPAPLWRGALAALPGSDSRGDVQILAGDFNATLDHPELRGLLDRGYTDAADAVGEGSTSTWPAPPRSAARCR